MKPIDSFHLPILGFLVACFFLQGMEAYSCPPDWINFQKDCYALKKIALDWNSAEAYCQSYGSQSHLASILSEEEAKRIAAVIAGSNDPGFHIWIGMQRKNKQGKVIKWRWTDNSNAGYTAWAEGQPDRSGFCVEIFGDEFDLWNDTDCDTENYFLCKMPLS